MWSLVSRGGQCPWWGRWRQSGRRAGSRARSALPRTTPPWPQLRGHWRCGRGSDGAVPPSSPLRDGLRRPDGRSSPSDGSRCAPRCSSFRLQLLTQLVHDPVEPALGGAHGDAQSCADLLVAPIHEMPQDDQCACLEGQLAEGTLYVRIGKRLFDRTVGWSVVEVLAGLLAESGAGPVQTHPVDPAGGVVVGRDRRPALIGPGHRLVGRRLGALYG